MTDNRVSVQDVLFSTGNGFLSVVHQGVVVGEIPIPSGRVPARRFFDLLPAGGHFEATGVSIVRPRSGLVRQKHAEHDNAGANPDWAPVRDQQQRRVQTMLLRMNQTEKRLAAREAALLSLPRIPDAPSSSPQGGERIEPESKEKEAPAK